MTEKDILELEKETIIKRIEELSVLLNEVKDSASKGALATNHQNSLERLGEVKAKLKELTKR